MGTFHSLQLDQIKENTEKNEQRLSSYWPEGLSDFIGYNHPEVRIRVNNLD